LTPCATFLALCPNSCLIERGHLVEHIKVGDTLRIKQKNPGENYVFFIRTEQHNTCAHMKTMQGGAANNERRPFLY
jgi:hypothetical protein